VDVLLENDIQLSRAATPAEKFAQAVELFEMGLRLKRAALKRASPGASDAVIEEALQCWLIADE
jgi:Rv0078B-related antitoxin